MLGQRAGGTNGNSVDAAFDLVDPLATEPERDETKHTERAVNQPPPEWDSSGCSKPECKRDDQDTSDQPEVKQPAIPHWISQRTNKRDGDDDMSECQPIRAKEQQRVLCIHIVQRVAHREQPATEFRVCGGAGLSGEAEPIDHDVQLPFQRNRCYPADYKADDKEPSEQLDPAMESLFTVHATGSVSGDRWRLRGRCVSAYNMT